MSDTSASCGTEEAPAAGPAFSRQRLAAIAHGLAVQTLAGNERKCGPAIEPFLAHFRSDSNEGFDWCSAFLFHCVRQAGLELPPRGYPGMALSFAVVPAWIEWGSLAHNGYYHAADDDAFVPEIGDLVIFDDLIPNGPHEHIGVIVDMTDHAFITAEGDVDNRTGIFVRRRNRHLNGCVRIPDGLTHG